ncbi:unnamed protein product, partial [Gongylonema pulchrum]|uniref:t-SNARE coiled-coil homology domain-containing protein n=1 Tax=Gongylonema pulchrum TaxID=637853 RepID=A0A183D4X6_9BILA
FIVGVFAGAVKSYTTVGNSNGNIEDDVNFYERELERYMQESLDSTQRSRKNLEQSEQVGIGAAQDLLAQREKLEHTEKNLDEIDKTTKMTQRNLNSLKSMPPSRSDSSLHATVDKLSTASSANSSYSGGAVSASGPTLSASSRAAIKGTRWETMDNEIDANLGNVFFSRVIALADLR